MSDPAAHAATARSTSAPPALDLEDVDIQGQAEPRTVVVRNLTWSVRTGDQWLVTGSPGGGKSTVLQVAAGLVRPARGRHRLFGREVSELSEPEVEELRSRIGLVFGAGGRLFHQLTVAENIALPLLYHGRRTGANGAARLQQAVEGLGLEDYLRRRPRDLPRRIAARAALARALVLAPEVLLLDDPAGDLPAEESDWWCRFVAECAAGRCAAGNPPTTVVIAAQDARPWRTLADHCAIVGDGSWQVTEPSAGPGRELRPAAAP